METIKVIIGMVILFTIIVYLLKKQQKKKNLSIQKKAYQDGGLKAIGELLSHKKCNLCDKEFEIDENEPLNLILGKICKNANGHFHVSCGWDPM